MNRQNRKLIKRASAKKKFQKDDQYLCYSDSGFLVDILEYNGFRIHSLERCDPNYGEFRLVVEMKADEELFRERLKKNLARLNLVNFKP